MEKHTVGLVVLVGMAVDALTCILCCQRHVIVYVALVEVGEVTLTNRQFFECHIRRLDVSVGDVRVDIFLCDVDVERTETNPLFTCFDKNLYYDAVSLGCIPQFCPFVLVDDDFGIVTVGVRQTSGGCQSCHNILCSLQNAEVRWTDICRHRHFGIVGTDVWQFLCFDI